MKRSSRDSESGTEDPLRLKKQKAESDKSENLTEPQICFMDVTNNQPANSKVNEMDINREKLNACENVNIYV